MLEFCGADNGTEQFKNNGPVLNYDVIIAMHLNTWPLLLHSFHELYTRQFVWSFKTNYLSIFSLFFFCFFIIVFEHLPTKRHLSVCLYVCMQSKQPQILSLRHVDIAPVCASPRGILDAMLIVDFCDSLDINKY